MATKARIAAGDGDPRHGTVNGYVNLKCRCPDCRKAWAERARALRREHELREPPVHGRSSSYLNWRCKCEDCTRANRFKHQDWVERRKRESA